MTCYQASTLRTNLNTHSLVPEFARPGHLNGRGALWKIYNGLLAATDFPINCYSGYFVRVKSPVIGWKP